MFAAIWEKLRIKIIFKKGSYKNKVTVFPLKYKIRLLFYGDKIVLNERSSFNEGSWIRRQCRR